MADIDTIETELMLADLGSLEKRVDNLTKKAKTNDKEAKEQLDLVNRTLVLLGEGRPARYLERKVEEEHAFGMKSLIVFLVATSFAFAAAPVEAKGCLKGAVVGGLAGHYAAHHGWLGAAAGCLYGRHRAKQQERQQQTQHQGQVTDTGPTGM